VGFGCLRQGVGAVDDGGDLPGRQQFQAQLLVAQGGAADGGDFDLLADERECVQFEAGSLVGGRTQDDDGAAEACAGEGELEEVVAADAVPDGVGTQAPCVNSRTCAGSWGSVECTMWS
jgi:hypothetical protein